MKYFIFLLFTKYEHSGSHAKLTTYFSQDPLCSYLDEQQKNDIYFLNNCRDVGIVPTFARQKIWQTSKFCHSRRYIRKYVSQAILCQTYGLVQMKKLPDLPKFCLVCLAGPAVNDNVHFKCL